MIKFTLYTLYLLIALTLTTLLTTNKISTMIIALISTFINIFMFLMVLNAEFLSISFLIIYVGAITILFVFSLMVVNNKVILEVKPLGLTTTLAGLALAHLSYALIKGLEYKLTYATVTNLYTNNRVGSLSDYNEWQVVYQTNDILLFANTMYTKYQTLFLLSGGLLLTAVIGVIALTLPSRITRAA